MIQTKNCTRCQRCLPLAMFNVRRERKTLQYHSYCKDCMRHRHAVRHKLRWSPKNERLYPAVDRSENNAFNLWHGPVSREPLRWRA